MELLVWRLESTLGKHTYAIFAQEKNLVNKQWHTFVLKAGFHTLT